MMGFMDLYLRMKIRRREKKKKSGNVCEHTKKKKIMDHGSPMEWKLIIENKKKKKWKEKKLYIQNTEGF